MRKISIYVCMSFEDMYCERNYLYTEVFPELKDWCREKHVHLEIVDPGCGLTEAECMNNNQALPVSLRGIDQCRPFFLGFLGQRRSFVPRAEDQIPSLMERYPGITDYLGQCSFLELGILHAKLEPFCQELVPASHCLLYSRDSEVVKEAVKSHPKLKKVYTNESRKKNLFSREDKMQNEEMEEFRKILKENAALIKYQAKWNASGKTPELAAYEGEDLSAGTMDDFRIPAQFGAESAKDGSLIDQIIPPQSLKKHILDNLKRAIEEELQNNSKIAEKIQTEEEDPYADIMRHISAEDRAVLEALPGFENPLYRKIILKELKEAGGADDWVSNIEKNYGHDEVSAFEGMYKRLLTETNGSWLREILGFLAFHEDGAVWQKLPGWMAAMEGTEENVGLPSESRKIFFYLSDFIGSDDQGLFCLYESEKQALQRLLKPIEEDFQQVLVQSYLIDCKPEGESLSDCRFAGEEPLSYVRLSAHAARLSIQFLEELIANPFYLEQKIRLCRLESLRPDFEALKRSTRWEEYRTLQRILELAEEVLNQDADQLYIQLLLRKGENSNPLLTELLDELKKDTSRSRLLPIQNYGEDADSPLESRFDVPLAGMKQAVFWNNCLAVLTDKEMILYDKVSGKCRKRSTLPMKSPKLAACGSGLLMESTLGEPVYAFSTDTWDCSELLPAGSGEWEKLPVSLYAEGEDLRICMTTEDNRVVFLEAAEKRIEEEMKFSEPIRLLGTDEKCFAVASDEKIFIYERETHRLLGQTGLKDKNHAVLQFAEDLMIVCSPSEVLVFKKDCGELISRLVPTLDQTNFGSYYEVLLSENHLLVSRDRGFIDMYDRNDFSFVNRLKLHENPVLAMTENRAFLYTMDAGGEVCVWNRSRIYRKENMGSSDGNVITDIFQANGSVYTFCRSHSAAMSPVNLKVRCQGEIVTGFNPEVQRRKYIVHWKKEPLTMMLLNLETLQNDYSCSFEPPEGFTSDDLVKMYWQETTGYILYNRKDGHTALQLLDMDTDRIVEEKIYGDIRSGTELLFREGELWLYAETMHKERYSFPGKCYCEFRKADSENPIFFLPMEKVCEIMETFVDDACLVFVRRIHSGKFPRLELVTADMSAVFREGEKNDPEKQPPIWCLTMPDGDLSLIQKQNGIAMYAYPDGRYVIIQYRTGTLLKKESEPGGRITACSLNKTNYFIAREGGKIEYHSYEDPAAQCRAYLDMEVRKMVGTGAGLVTIWTQNDSIISFQMEKAKRK